MSFVHATLAVLVLSAAGCGASSDNAGTSAPMPAQEEMPAAKPAESAAPASQNVVQVAIAAGTFKTLVAAVQAAGLAEVLQGPGPFTVFAPTDEAFAKLPAGTVDALLADKAKLTTILKYHVVSGLVDSSQIGGMTKAATLEGRELKIDTSSGVRINDATVLKADVQASNGVIHVIDTVLIPQ